MQDAVAKIGKQMGSNAVKTERTKKIRIGGKPKSGTQGTFAWKEIGVTVGLPTATTIILVSL